MEKGISYEIKYINYKRGGKSEKEKGDKSIRAQAYFVTELFLHFFRRIDLDGSDKLVIVIVKICSDIAIRNGKPELIETIEQAAEKLKEIDDYG